MMGTHQPQPSLFAYRVDLEQRIRFDHPLRRVAAVVDFSFVRTQVASCYGWVGVNS
jgi:transposase